jgi:hypothetical protein
MTLEKRYLITPDDISAFEFQCINESCGVRVRIPSALGSKLPEYCPECRKRWFNPSDPQSSDGFKAIVAFMDSRRDLERLKGNMTCSVRLELRFVE